jgi:hypothetical protein
VSAFNVGKVERVRGGAFFIIENGLEAEAETAATEFSRLSPNFSLDVARQTWPCKDRSVLERYIAALHKAGLE